MGSPPVYVTISLYSIWIEAVLEMRLLELCARVVYGAMSSS